MRRVQREQSELQPPPVPPPPLLRPDVFTSKSIFMNKPRGCSLGVDLDSDSTEGAEVDSVEAFGLAWRNGLKPGDRILCVRAFSTVRPCEVLSEHPVVDGYSAALALRPAFGRIELRILRPVPSREAVAATAIQAIWRGMLSRQMSTLDEAHPDWMRQWVREGASVVIQSHFRRLLAMWEARERLDLRDREHAEDIEWAVLTIQTTWRRYGAWINAYTRTFALQLIQEAARVWLHHKSNRRSRSPGADSSCDSPGGSIPSLARQSHKVASESDSCEKRVLGHRRRLSETDTSATDSETDSETDGGGIRAPPCLDW